MVGVLRDLVKHGIRPSDAVRFATLNNAQRLAQAGIAEAALLGAIAPGMAADLVLVAEPLKELRVGLVIHEGVVVAENGKLTRPVPTARVPQAALDTIHVSPVAESTFRIAAPPGVRDGTARVRVLALPKPPALPFPDLLEADMPVADGYLDPRGYILIAVFNRYGKGGQAPVIGLIQGYSLKDGAVASTLAHDSHNLIVLGIRPAEMALAANTVLEMKGGMAAVRGEEILAEIAFPIGGLMSPQTVEAMARPAAAFRQAIGALGLDPKSPILPFAVFSLPAGPGAKVTDRGIWDGDRQVLVPLLV
jgi:adenine deaminase